MATWATFTFVVRRIVIRWMNHVISLACISAVGQFVRLVDSNLLFRLRLVVHHFVQVERGKWSKRILLSGTVISRSLRWRRDVGVINALKKRNKSSRRFQCGPALFPAIASIKRDKEGNGQ